VAIALIGIRQMRFGAQDHVADGTGDLLGDADTGEEFFRVGGAALFIVLFMRIIDTVMQPGG